jgi:O-acetyl-ADP-ribose deacetylase (regulator of RNase III)
LAFPSISTGAYGFPMERAARIAVREVARFLEAHELPERVVLVCFDETAARAHREALAGER